MPPRCLERVLICLLLCGLALACSAPLRSGGPITLSAPTAQVATLQKIIAEPTATLTPTVLPTAAPTPTLSPSPTPEPITIPQYFFQVEFDYPAHQLAITETITYVNTSSETLTDLLLLVEPARQEGVFTLNSLAWEDTALVERYTLAGAHLRLPLRQPLASGQAVKVIIRYELALTSGNGTLGYSARQTNLGDWYPYVPPYRPGIGWLAYEPSKVGEHLVYEVADFVVDIRFINAPPGLVIASSGVGQQASGVYRSWLQKGRTFAWSASDQYVVAQTRVGNVLISNYAFPEHTTQQRDALQVTANAVALYSKLFAPYPHPGLSAVESDFFDGMEYDGLYFLGREYYESHPNSPAGYLTALSAHETAHQWWYGLVGNDSAWEPWLDEALCTYSERLYYEHFHPELVRWWWEYRADRFKPKGWVNSTIYDQQNFRAYVDAVYLRGARFLEDLRNLIGDEAFFATLKDYASQNAGGIATGDEFFALLHTYTTKDFHDLRAIYFRAEGQP